VLQSLPGYRTEFIEDGRWFWLQATEQPEDMLADAGKALANDIKARLGHPRAFYGHDPKTPAFMATYETPAFDFSEIRAIPQSA
jgi:hypothetical protein